MTGKKSTQFYHSWLGSLEKLAQKSKDLTCDLMLSLLRYGATGERPDFEDFTADILFNEYAGAIDRDNEKYQQKVQANQENGKKGGRPKNPLGFEKTERFLEKPKKPDKDKDIDKDKDKDIDKEKGEDKDIEPRSSGNQDKQIQQIIEAWNRNKWIRSRIDRIPPLSKRYNDTFLTIGTFGFETFLEQIRKLDDNKFFEDWHPSYDWFCDPNNFNKVYDGNYLEGKKKPIDVNSKEYWDSL